MTGYQSKKSAATSKNSYTWEHRMKAPNRFMLIDQTKDKLPAPPEGYVTVECSPKISMWVETQPLDQWKHGDVPAYSFLYDRFTVSKELYTLMALTW